MCRRLFEVWKARKMLLCMFGQGCLFAYLLTAAPMMYSQAGAAPAVAVPPPGDQPAAIAEASAVLETASGDASASAAAAPADAAAAAAPSAGAAEEAEAEVSPFSYISSTMGWETFHLVMTLWNQQIDIPARSDEKDWRLLVGAFRGCIPKVGCVCWLHCSRSVCLRVAACCLAKMSAIPSNQQSV